MAHIKSNLAASKGRRSRFARAIRLTPALALVLAVGVSYDGGNPTPATAAAPALPAPPANGEMGFVVVTFHPAVNQGDMKVDCPNGIAGVLKDHYLLTLPQAERERLMKPENERELARAWNAYGAPNGRNICTYWYEYTDRPPIPGLKSDIGYGIDLDGDVTPGAPKLTNTCAHKPITSPDGKTGLDNQAWRVFGCSNLWRGVDGMGGDAVSGSNGFVKTGEWTQVIRLRGVQSLVNDPDVEILYANTDDRPVTDNSGKWIHNASFTVTDTPVKQKYRNILKGKIVNGVLTTEPQTIWLSQTWGQGGNFGGQRTNWEFRNGRIQMTFQPDGTLKGLVGGYQPLFKLIQSTVLGGGGAVAAGGRNCAGEMTGMMAMADGDRDPKTGKCTTISSAYAAFAVPAFVNDRPSKVASR